MGRLGLGDFLSGKGSTRSGRAGWLKKWKKNPGYIHIWLHTLADFLTEHSHHFHVEVEEENDAGKKVRKLRYRTFISPESDDLLMDQHLRAAKNNWNTGEVHPLKTPPTQDHFLLLREWLILHRPDIKAEEVIFEWFDHQENRKIQWLKGQITGELKRGQYTSGHHLNSQMSWIFTVVDNADIAAGPVLARAKKSLGERMRESIEQEMLSHGDDDGNPLVTPYCFRWVFDEAAGKQNPAKYYNAFRYAKAQFTDEIHAQVTSEEFPDGEELVRPKEGDEAKIQAYMELAARIKLPQELFSPDLDARRSLALPSLAPRGRQVASTATPRRTGGVKSPSERKAQSTPAQSPAPAGRRRRRRVKKPEPPPEPKVEMLPCDSCEKDIPATAKVCPFCGEEYAFDDDPVDQVPADNAVDESFFDGSNATASESTASESTASESTESDECLMCGTAGRIEDDVCLACGMNQGDDLPF